MAPLRPLSTTTTNSVTSTSQITGSAPIPVPLPPNPDLFVMGGGGGGGEAPSSDHRRPLQGPSRPFVVNPHSVKFIQSRPFGYSSETEDEDDRLAGILFTGDSEEELLEEHLEISKADL